mgnify:CR=1 FL=1
MPLDIPKHELGVTRVFALSMTSQEASHLRDDVVTQAKALGAAPVNTNGIEVFPLSDLGDMGLAGYLREGVDANPDDLARDKAKLAALDGWVMLVHSTAYAPQGATLAPISALTLIGTYAQTAAEQPTVALEAEAAKPFTGAAPKALPERAQMRASGSWVVIALILLTIALVLWAFS